MNNLCFCSLSGEVITKCSTDYEQARQLWNRAIQKYPIAIVYCKNNEDVINAVLWARKERVPIRIRAGGHNYEGYSSGDCVLVIDVSQLKSINVDLNENTVTIGTGVTNGMLYNALGTLSYPFPGGTCPSVCVSGYAMGGGWGLSSRKFGLGCDSLLEVQLINYTGELIVANSMVNCDLFWAIKGSGGGNYGVVVSLKFKLPQQVSSVTLFDIKYSNICLNEQKLFFKTWQSWINTTSNDINARTSIFNSFENGKGISMFGISYKDLEETTQLLTPFLLINNVSLDIKEVSFLDAVNEIGAIYPQYDYFISSGRFVNRYFSDCEINEMLNIINKDIPIGSELTAINFYGLGGSVSDVNKFDTAFYYRDSSYILLLQSEFKDNLYKVYSDEWFYRNFKYIYSLTNGSYVNFPYNRLINYNFNYYGKNLFRLKCVKKKYDPLNVFTFPQGI